MTRGVRNAVGRVWTDERNTELVRLHSAGVEYDEIIDYLDDLPGGWIAARHSLPNQVCYLKRIGEYQKILANLPEPGWPSANTGVAVVAACLDVSSLNSPPEPQAPAAFFGAGNCLVVTYDYAKKWAETHGLKRRRHEGLNLKQVNAIRRRINQAPFVLQGCE